MDDDNAFVLAKLAIMETLLRDLYAEWLDRLQEPIEVAERRREAYDKGHSALADPSTPEPFALLPGEMMNQFFDDVIEQLRRRAERRSQDKQP
jgi:hypothetical protein